RAPRGRDLLRRGRWSGVPRPRGPGGDGRRPGAARAVRGRRGRGLPGGVHLPRGRAAPPGRAALRTADQRRGRVPTRCVKTGAPTEGAVHAWAVELPSADVLWLLVGPVLRVAALAGRRSERIVLP